MEEEVTFYVFGSNKMLTLPNLYRSQNDVKSYPKEWFVKNVGQKPNIPILIRYNSLETLRPIIKAQINDHKLDLDLVKEYIYIWGKTVTAVCDEDWNSFGTTIARARQEVHPWSVLEVEITYPDPEVSNIAGAAANADDLESIVILVGLYRILREKTEMQKTLAAKKIQDQTRFRGANSSLLSLAPHCDEWKSNKDFTKMIAALDMFLFKFKDHQYSKLRAGTFMSRHRDCWALTLIEDLTKLLGIDKASLLNWIFCASIADEIRILTATEQETEVQHSYFPYQIDMDIVPRSAYSTACNPCLFLFAHSVGALLGAEKSINMRMCSQRDTENIHQNAKIVAFVFAQNQGTNEQGNAKCEGTPKTQDAKEWLAFMKNRRLEPTPTMNRFFAVAKSRIVNPKNGTIGEYIKNRL